MIDEDDFMLAASATNHEYIYIYIYFSIEDSVEIHEEEGDLRNL